MAGRLVHWETDFTTGTRSGRATPWRCLASAFPTAAAVSAAATTNSGPQSIPTTDTSCRHFTNWPTSKTGFRSNIAFSGRMAAYAGCRAASQVIARGPDGKAQRMVNVVTDITDRKIGEEHVHSLLAEITHRGKNLLAVIQAIASQTGRSTVSFEEFQERFTRRLHGLAASHDLLVMQNWKGASLANLVRKQLAPFAEWDSGAIQTLGTGYLSKSQDYRDPRSWRCTNWRPTRSSTVRYRYRREQSIFLGKSKTQYGADAGTAENGLGRTRWPAGHAAVA